MEIAQRLLLIGDRPAFYEELQKGLGGFSTTVDSAFLLDEGIERVRSAILDRHPYFLVCVDVQILGQKEAIHKIWEIDPDIQVILCTPRNEETWHEIVRQLAFSPRLVVLKHPFDPVEMVQLVRALSEKWHLLQQMQTQVDERTAEIRATLEATADGIVVVSQQVKILDYNQNFIRIWQGLQWNSEGVEAILRRGEPGELIAFITANIHDAQAVREVLENLFYRFDRNGFSELHLELHVKNGNCIELFTRPLFHKKEMIGRVLSFRDVTERSHFEEQLSFQASHDILTNLPNRILLLDRISQAIFQAKRSKTSVAVLYLDLDRFKFVNDSLGHNYGDELLKAATERLQNCKREADTLCRMGGDEFVFIIPGLHEESHVMPIIHKIQNAFSEPFMINKTQLTISASIGVCFYPKNGLDATILLKNADAAMYKAKAVGKNTFQFYADEMNVQMKERLELEQSLHQAFERGELHLYYQPYVDAQTREIIGSEALLRWEHPEKGLISPLKFIPIAEETGLIVPIGEWVLRTACEQNLFWQKMGLPIRPISVNLSGMQVTRVEPLLKIEKILQELNYDGRYLEFELTENVLMASTEETKNIFSRLKELGVSFVIDDFGTGYSNLSYLMHFPITKLKIDKSFIDGIPSDPNDAAIIQAIITMAHTLKIKVIGEGVETEEQYQFLIDHGCDEVQGFYFSQPLEITAYTLLLQAGFKSPQLG